MVPAEGSTSANARDEQYGEVLLTPLWTCANYLPRMGGSDAVDIDGFKELYGSDPLYHWMGFDSDLMFAAHKAAGGMTSVYRQLGIGCERLFRRILMDELGLTAEQVVWSYEVLAEQDPEATKAAKARILSLDGRVESDDIQALDRQKRFRDWMQAQQRALNITVELKGTVFEVRQGYKSADSKRQNADLSNASQALGRGYLPGLVIMSSQINQVVYERYKIGNWAVLLGVLGLNDPLKSTFDFLREVIGYDLVAFFERNSPRLRSEVETILRKLLEAK